ncbi:Crp/Fnr family transcriptional regulator [Maribellus sediminis]|uniref:Crp/Fnr family transcriptional regulator n=1 Tax=Maribellus sediminis TaxID=2696285 RepID=UPI00142FAEE4|nr:Crp/Fnr family transcriptional regulator [Maribellus sediminis]
MSLPFKELTVEQLIEINRNRAEITFKKGETIFKQGVMASHLVYLKTGLVKLYRENGHEEMILSIEGKGKLLGLQALFGKNLYPYSVQAYTETKVCLHDKSTIQDFINQNAGFAACLMKQLSDESLFWYDRTACLTLKQLHGRFADLLLCLSLRIYRRKKFKVPISKKEMAAVTNMSQESLSRVIKDFVGDKIIEMKGSEISILNYEKIRHLSMVG